MTDHPSPPKVEVSFTSLVGVSVSLGILHQYVVNPLQNAQPGAPGCIL